MMSKLDESDGFGEGCGNCTYRDAPMNTEECVMCINGWDGWEAIDENWMFIDSVI